ncbi:hypothetical protein [Comamonas thiooxydans]|uniref:hypothetical protein n=1 Tax=Comamonas thiooxydans TaxID=363952 RepID=UPI000B4198AF|nr:hypothetical protein [Comamonas thiooxydans]
MDWMDKINRPYTVTFKLPRSDDTSLSPSPRAKLDEIANKAIRSCTFNSAIYVVFCNDLPQYVGQSGDVCTRFINGVNYEANGYLWPKIGGEFTVYFFEVPLEEHFRTAVEIEVMLLIRLYIGYWPIETSGAQPFHQLKTKNHAINLASTRAREILDWLIQLQPKFEDTAQDPLLASFDHSEANLNRR